MEDFQSIKITQHDEAIEIDASKHYPIISKGSQSVIFKIFEEQCLKVYTNMEQFKLEADGLAAAQEFPFIPKLYKIGPNYIVREFIDAPTLKDYLKNCTYMPESVAVKLLGLVKEMDKGNLMMGRAPLKHIFVLGNEELKWVRPFEAAQEDPSVPLSLLNELKDILLKDSFLSHVKNLDPGLYGKWMKFFRRDRLDIEKITAFSEGTDEISTHNLIGQGRQGAVYRVDEEKCVKIYGKESHFIKEREVLEACQHLSFIPKVYETGPNYILMEYLQGPDLNTFLKRQSKLPEEVTRNLLEILKTMKKFGFKKIDAPLRHIFIASNGFKLVDHVYSFSKKQDRPLELFRNLHERNFLDSFLEQVEEIDPITYAEWTSRPIPLTKEAAAAEVEYSRKIKKAKKEKRK